MPISKLDIIDYDYYYQNLNLLSTYNYKLYPMLIQGWDNTARRNIAPTLILQDSTPEKFEHWFKLIVDDFVPYSKEENFIFINTWNEWAEGNHLEPCTKWGHAYLEAIHDVLKGNI